MDSSVSPSAVVLAAGKEVADEASASAAATAEDVAEAAVAAAAAAWTEQGDVNNDVTTARQLTGDVGAAASASAPGEAAAPGAAAAAERTAKPWKPEEVEAFRAALFRHGPVWDLVAGRMESRSPKACESYYYRCYVKDHPNETYASTGGTEMKRWTDAEKSAFHAAFREHGVGNWALIANSIPGRTTKSVERYYYRVYRKFHPELLERAAAAKRGGGGGGGATTSKSWTQAEKQTFHEEYCKRGGCADWSQISAVLPGRTPRAVEQYYYKNYRGVDGGGNNEMMKIKHWTQAEKDQFAEAYAEFGGDFDKISGAIKTRDAKSCERYFYRKYRKENEVRGDKKYIHWKEEEKDAFVKAFEEHGRNWNKIAEQIPGDRSAKAVELHYYKRKTRNKNNAQQGSSGSGAGGGGGRVTSVVDASTNYSFWSAEEKLAFEASFKIHGHDWEKVASQIRGRTAKSCERYFYRIFRKENSTADETNNGPDSNKKYMQWTNEEKEAFRKAVTEHGPDFEKIASSLPGRTVQSCERYYYRHYRKSTQNESNHIHKRYNHWTDDDKKAFKTAYEQVGRQWEKIADLLPGRTPKACEIHYYKVFKKEHPSEEADIPKKKPLQSVNDARDDDDKDEDEERPSKKARTSAKGNNKTAGSSKKSPPRRTGTNKTPDKVGGSNEQSSSKKRTVGSGGRTIGSKRRLRSGKKSMKEEETAIV